MTRCEVEITRVPLYESLGWRVVCAYFSPKLDTRAALIEHQEAPPPYPEDHGHDAIRINDDR